MEKRENEKLEEKSENENEKVEGKTRVICVPPVGRCSSFLCSEAKPDAEQFQGALRELKDLRSQLHQAADYCENAFLKEEKKKMILDSTKSYICDAIVAVIDHLGTVSSKLELELCNVAKATQTEQKMDFLRQRLLMCQQFAVTAELATFRYREKLMHHHPQYLSDGQILKKYDSSSRVEEGSRQIKDSHGKEKFGLSGRFQHVETGTEHVMILPGQHGQPILVTPSFGLKGTHNIGGDDKKKMQHNFLAFLSKNRKKSR
ncbi:ABL interactor-like protein 3 [Rhynchospora pubera]|uniref:ABL interactor-like protein 3 n=1 Tax=Rhynchospora pubera TaxID=906938 RepID=A0AAV8DNS1_9POAL|nr:ABL interactor-like protein 3 [Rhynchospora pubera]